MAENKPSGANKYSIYQQRDLESEMVDWGSIAQDINKGIQGVMADREARKDAIAKNTQDALDKLSEVQDVDNQDIQSLLIGGSDNSKKALMEANYLLKNGLMTEKDYALVVQQQKSGYSALNNLAKNADAKYKEAMTRLADGDSSAIEDWNNNTLLGFGNLKNTQLVSNPLTGELQMVRLVKNPNYVANSTKPGEMEQWIMPDPNTHPENYQSPTQMTKASTFKLDKVTTKGLATTQTEGLGSIITSTISNYSVLSGGGDVTKVTSFKQLFDIDATGGLEIDGKTVTYEDFMSTQVDAVVGPADQKNNMNAAQVLGEMGYEIGGSCEEVKERTNNTAFDCSKWIKATNSSGTPVVTLTDAQQKAARNRVRLEMEAHLDNETKITAGKAGQQISAQNQATKDENISTAAYIGDLNKVLTGDIATAETTLKGMIETRNIQNKANNQALITDFDLTDDRIVFYMDDGTSITRDRSIYADTDVNQDGVIDARDISSQTGVGQDIAGIFDILVPGGQGIKTGMADTQILDFIKSQNIALGERGTDRALSYQGTEATPQVRTSKTKLSKSDPRSLTEILKEGNIGDKNNALFDTDEGLRQDIEKTFTTFFSSADEKRFRDAGFETIEFTSSGDKQYIKFMDTRETPPKEINLEIGTDIGKTRTMTDKVATALANILNDVNEMAYDRVKGGKRGTKLNYSQWAAKNPRGTKTLEQHIKEFNKQFKK